MAEELEALVRSVPFFRDLERIDVARLIGSLEEVRAKEGELIFSESTEADALYLLQRGRVQVTVSTEHGERRLALLDAPAFFGELGLLLARRTSTVRARSDVVLQRLPRNRFEELARERPRVALQVATALAERFERRQRHLVGAPAPPRREATLEPRQTRRLGRRAVLGSALALLLPVLLWSLPPPHGLDAVGWRVVLIVAGAAIAWLSEPVPDFAVAVAAAAAWGLLGLAPLGAVFSGFASSSWVTAFGAIVVAAAMTRSGLLFRTALWLLRIFPATHRGQVTALLLGGVVTTPLVPLSVARVGAVAPLGVELAQALGYAPRGRASAGLSFAAFTGYWYFSSIFLSGLATNFFVLGLLPAAERARFTWVGWLEGAAVCGLVCLAGAALALFALFPPEGPPTRSPDVVERQRRVLGPMSRAEWVALGALGVLLAGLVTQPLTGLDAAWAGLVAVVVAVAGRVIDRERFRSSIDWGFLTLFGLLLSWGEVLRASHVDRWIADSVMPVASAIGNGGLMIVLLTLACVAIRFVLPSRPTFFLLCLALVPLAPALGLAGWVVGFVVLVAANVWIFPYMGLEYLIARDATRGEGFDDRQGIRMGTALTIVRVIAVAASVPYWYALGLVR